MFDSLNEIPRREKAPALFGKITVNCLRKTVFFFAMTLLPWFVVSLFFARYAKCVSFFFCLFAVVKSLCKSPKQLLLFFWHTTRRSHNIFNSSFFPKKKNSGNGIAGKGILSGQSQGNVKARDLKF